MPPDAFVARVRRTIDERELLKGGERVVVAVSGGPDSLAMLHALATLAPDLELALHVAHFDHRLRHDSEQDAALVARHARDLGLPVTTGAAADPERDPRRSPEEDARVKRRRFLEGVAEQVHAGRIATGHTMDDQAETVLMRLLQGTGRRGLGGIDPRRWWRIRPLLDVRRAEAAAYCAALGLTPIEDPTNTDRRLLRNAIRLDVLPHLAGTINVRVVEALARLADVVRDEDAYLDERAGDGAPAVQDDGGRVTVSIDPLRALPPALQRRALRLATWTHANVVFSAEHTERLRILALRGSTSDRVELPEGIVGHLEYGCLVLDRRREPPSSPAPVDLDVPGEVDLVPWGIRVRSWITGGPVRAWPDGRWQCVMDADRIAFPLRVRAWQLGDRFRPLGMSGEKKVGDFFTDERVPKGRRAEVPVVIGADGTIVWIVGHRIDDRARVTDDTRRHLWLQV